MELTYKLNLQLFADEEKTEKATAKKRKEAREKGQVLKSQEINSALLIIGTFVGLKIFGSYMYSNIRDFTQRVLSHYNEIDDLFTIKGINNMFYEIIIVAAQTVAPIAAVALIIGLLSNYMQVGFLFSTKSIGIKFSKINPIEGFKRIFSPKSIVELVKSLIKVFVIGYVAFSYILKQMNFIYNLLDMSIAAIVTYIGDITFGIALRAGGVLIVIAVIDYIYQWWDFEKNLKMSKKEIKEEHKQTEGDPMIKSKIKEKQRQIAMTRMMQDVPKADVIITNPTHYAIALKYDKEKCDAPFILAKGKDLIAQNIKKVAKESDIPMVENKPLAQALYKSVEIGDIIPEELYQAVAEVLAYVYGLRHN
ncbi:flagellar biosynthesis protein FlhB [Sporosalibacterium faouarense]|uniref:flagellar biosynthesis protein FlhB n=1 Tax=Sporosalibacterium faouarense TaxID=516123 RepID=UPI00141D2A7D|nr:flagellar biosynthesis protein FlhB [Sporosalibacterium faouarense]MTI48007.1 flagellar biosynthesis protein FlhB [Bacillota bacterium]